MNGGVALCVEVDPQRIRRRLETRYLDEQADDLDDAVSRCEAAKAERRAAQRRPVRQRGRRRCRSCAEIGFEADIVTDQTSAHDPLNGYVPNRPDSRGGRRASRGRPRRVRAPRASAACAAHCAAMVGFLDDGARGVRLRQQPARRGSARRLRAGLRLSRLRPRLHPPAVLRGKGPVSLGGAVGRGGRHRGDRPRGARGDPRRSRPGALDPAGRRADRISGAAGAGSAGPATASASGSGCASTRWCAPASSERRS